MQISGDRYSYYNISSTEACLGRLKNHSLLIFLIDRFEYMEKYGSALVSCNSTDQLIWKDQICDGKEDCMNGEDEKDCRSCKKASFHLQALLSGSWGGQL